MSILFASAPDNWAQLAGNSSRYVPLAMGGVRVSANMTRSKVGVKDGRVELRQEASYSMGCAYATLAMCLGLVGGAVGVAYKMALLTPQVVAGCVVGAVLVACIGLGLAYGGRAKASGERVIAFDLNKSELIVMPGDVRFPAREWVGIQLLRQTITRPNQGVDGARYETVQEDEIYFMRRHADGRLERLYYATNQGVGSWWNNPVFGCRWLRQWVKVTGLPPERVVMVRVKLTDTGHGMAG